MLVTWPWYTLSWETMRSMTRGCCSDSKVWVFQLRALFLPREQLLAVVILSVHWSVWDACYIDLMMNSPYYRYLRANALSPVRYYSTYRDRYNQRPWSPTHSQIIHDRVEHALRRNRSLERLDRLRSRYPYTVCSVFH